MVNDSCSNSVLLTTPIAIIHIVISFTTWTCGSYFSKELATIANSLANYLL